MFKTRRISELSKLPGNPRTIKKTDLEKLIQSVKNNPEYFEARPLILSNRTGELIIIAGNQRFEAAKAIGLEEVPTFLIAGLTEAKEREIIIRDNVNNGEWDHDLLANEWDEIELEAWGLDIPVSTSEEEAPLPTVISKKLIVECGDLEKLEELYGELQDKGFVVSLK